MKKKANEKKKSELKNKQTTKQSPRRFEPGKMVSEAVALDNEPRRHRVSGDQIYNI